MTTVRSAVWHDPIMLRGIAVLLALVHDGTSLVAADGAIDSLDQGREPFSATAIESIHRAGYRAAPHRPGHPTSTGVAFPALRLARRIGCRPSGNTARPSPQRLEAAVAPEVPLRPTAHLSSAASPQRMALENLRWGEELNRGLHPANLARFWQETR